MNAQNLFIGNILQIWQVSKLLKKYYESIFLLVKLKFAEQFYAMPNSFKALNEQRNLVILLQNDRKCRK